MWATGTLALLAVASVVAAADPLAPVPELEGLDSPPSLGQPSAADVAAAAEAWVKQSELPRTTLTGYHLGLTASTASSGYDPASPLCAMCADNYNAYKVGMVCDPCDGVTINVNLLIGFFALGLVLLAAVVTGAYTWAVNNGMTTDLRIALGLYQILAQADIVLQLTFPSPVPELMAFAKLLFLDIRAVLRMDCFDLGGFYVKLITNIFVLPMVATFACYAYYLYERKELDRKIAKDTISESGRQSAKLNFERNLMILTCLIYPMMCTTLFSIPMCRELSGASFHESDYWVSCESSSFSTLLVIAALGVLMVPFGVPLVFYLKMRAAVQELDGANENAAGGAKLVSDDMDDQSDRFAFLCQNYKPKYWYWEPVSYFRKLVLNGLAVVVGRGTMGQVYFAAISTTLFFFLHVRTYPFVIYKHNLMEAIGQATQLVMYFTCLLLRNDDETVWESEWVNRTGYGWMLVFLYVAVCPSPMFYSLWVTARADREERHEEMEFDNPLGHDEADAAGGGATQSSDKRARMAKESSVDSTG